MPDSSGHAGTYRRVGEVTAHRLDSGATWTTQGGDELAGARGDWLVESPSAGVRTVKADEFTRLYEHIEGDRWRRTGSVTAARAVESSVVQTLEGPATARVGDWIVTAPDGSSWPVPDEVFRESYEQV